MEERKSNGFLKLEDSPSNGLIKYRRQKRARPGSDAIRVRWIRSFLLSLNRKIESLFASSVVQTIG